MPTHGRVYARPRPRPAPTPIFFFFFFGGGRDDDDDGGCDDDDACAGSTHVSMRQARSKHISVKREDAHLVPVEESPLRIADGREEEAPARRRGLTHLGLEPRLSHIQRAHLMGAESRSLHARKTVAGAPAFRLLAVSAALRPLGARGHGTASRSQQPRPHARMRPTSPCAVSLLAARLRGGLQKVPEGNVPFLGELGVVSDTYASPQVPQMRGYAQTVSGTGPPL